MKVLSLTFTSLTWDFQRAQETHKTGFSTDIFGYTLRSDLLPGFDFGSDYSLFQGSVLSDSAKFAPYLTSIRATFTLDAKSPVVHMFAKLLGVAPPPPPNSYGRDTTGTLQRQGMNQSDATISQMQTVTGPNSPQSLMQVPTNQGFNASITFTKNQQRPPVGANVICAPIRDFAQCAALVVSTGPA